MQSSKSLTSSCRHCRYYVPQGRRGGHCNQLNVAVQGQWSACSLAISPFATTWEDLEEIIIWQQKSLAMETVSVEDCSEKEKDSSEIGSSVRLRG